MSLELMSLRQVREQFGISKSQFWRWRVAGKFPQPQARIGARQLWTREQIERFVAKGGAR
jgi:predicted DNA-binding transcriptional regulator AlpA